jgi:CRP/FNR family transcriptional regulator, cyclic AMP receptor protein
MELNLLEDLSVDERDALLTKCVRRRFARRQALFHFGDPSNGMYVVAKGRVVVRISTPTGEEASLTVIGPGQSVGEQSLLVQGGRRSASAVALEPVETLFLSRQAFLELRAEDAGFDQVMLRILAARVIRLTDQLIEALFVPATTRVLRRVIDAAALYGDGTIPLTQEELAAMAGSTRNTANRVLRAAQDAALLEVKRGRITVLDMRGLRRLADAGG